MRSETRYRLNGAAAVSLLLVESGKVTRFGHWPDLPETLQARDAEQVRLLLCITRERVGVGPPR